MLSLAQSILAGTDGAGEAAPSPPAPAPPPPPTTFTPGVSVWASLRAQSAAAKAGGAVPPAPPAAPPAPTVDGVLSPSAIKNWF